MYCLIRIHYCAKKCVTCEFVISKCIQHMPYTIRAYRGFGSPSSVFINGQVTRETIETALPTQEGRRQRVWRRFYEAIKLAVTRRVPLGRVRIHVAETCVEVGLDRCGHFSAAIALDLAHQDALWLRYQVELLSPATVHAVAAEGEVLIAPESAERIIVSDIDDTVIYTGVANKAMMLWRLFAHGADDKVPFPGIGAFYRGLQRSDESGQVNPAIFVSRSPWSIYPVLEEFFTSQNVSPKPVIQLREWGITWRHPFPRRARSHKEQLLRSVAEHCPDQPIILIGDSGQADPELYRDFALLHPQRVEAIYIRDVGKSQQRRRELRSMIALLASHDIPMILAASTEDLAADALYRGFIDKAAMAAVRGEAAP